MNELSNDTELIPASAAACATDATVSAVDWPNWAPRFLAALAANGVVATAAAAAGIDRATAYRWRDRAPEFAAKWTEALDDAIDEAESELFRRAVRGVDRAQFYCGVQCGVVREYSDSLLKFFLASRRPAVYGDRSSVEVSGPAGTPISLEYKRALDLIYGSAPGAVIDVTPEPDPDPAPAPPAPEPGQGGAGA